MQTRQEAQKKMQEQPLVQQLAQNRLKYLQFGMQQKQNAATGRLGTSPLAQQAGPAPGGPAPAAGPAAGPPQEAAPPPAPEPAGAY